MTDLSQPVAAELVGLTTRRLQQLAHETDPPPKGEGGYPAKELGEWIRRRAIAEIHINEEGETFDYLGERARLTHEQADKVALENAELRADLVRMSVVEPYWAAMGATVRQKLLSIPNHLGALVADREQRAKFITNAETLINEALAEIQKDAVPREIRERAERQMAEGNKTA